MRHTLLYILCACACVAICSCSVDKFLAEDELYLQSVGVTTENKMATKNFDMDGYVKQRPNSKWFVAKVPMGIYTLSKPGSRKWSSNLLRKMGQKPEVFDSVRAERSMADMRQVLGNAGYIHSEVKLEKRIKKRHLRLTYHVVPGLRYTVGALVRQVDDPRLRELLCGQDTAQSLLRQGMAFDINVLNEERQRITSMLRNRGYYKFNKDHITFEADTLWGSTDVHLGMHVKLHLENGSSTPEAHTQFRIGRIDYYSDMGNNQVPTDSIAHQGSTIYYGGGKLHFRPNLLTSNTMLKRGAYYSEEAQRRTYNNFMRLQAMAYSNIRFQQRPGTDTLDASIVVNHARPRSISFDIEGTNSAGDLGAAASVSYQQKNLFRGSEVLTFKLRGAYEAITGLDGYEGNDYTEIGGEARLSFPGFLLPFVKREYGASHHATSEVSLQYNLQERPEFNRRVLTGAWRYRWQTNQQHAQHRFDLLEVNYIYMPWISPRFKEQYLDSLGKQNAILRYNYENLLITKIGYSYTYNSLGTAVSTTYGKNAYTFRANIEASGNVLYGLTSMVDGKQNDQGQYTFCGIAFAQYAKGDFDFAKSIRIDPNNSVAFHVGFGIAYPYGNSSVLPFEKRYFAGGANSVRGWSVRSLGPGAYKGADRQINFINQSGDIKLDLSLEYRAYLFWKLNGALFIDGGNIWTIRKYDDQPEGEFRFDRFYKQLAASYGVGLRLNLDFFTLRFDAGMKAVNPAYEKGDHHYPLLHPDFSRDFAFHFAVGLPF